MSLANQSAREYLTGAQPRVSQRAQKEPACRSLSIEEYAEWDDLADKSPHGTIFHRSWWLAANDADFSILAVRNERGALAAGIPVPSEHQMVLPFATYLGPIFDLSTIEGTCDKLHLMRSHGELLAQNLTSFGSCQCSAGAFAPDLQGFLWAGFQARLGYTYRVLARRDGKQVASDILPAEVEGPTEMSQSNLVVLRDERMDDVSFLSANTLKSEGSNSGDSHTFPSKLWQVAYDRQHAHSYVERTIDHTPVAAILTVHDSRTTYHLASGVNPDLQGTFTADVAFEHAIQDSLRAGRDFDFGAPNVPDDENFFRRCGAIVVPTWSLERPSIWRCGLFKSLTDRRRRARS